METISVPQFRVVNAHFITDQLAVGGDLDMYDDALALSQVVELFEVGITHILDVRMEADDSETWSEGPEISYRWDGIDDAGQRVPGAWFDEVTDWALEALKDPSARLLTHCHMGINRGPSAGYAVLIAQGWDPIEAIEAIRRARPIAFVAYAEDALAWHHDRTGATRDQRRTDIARLTSWRRENNLDVANVIRTIRVAQAAR